jgi:hypothetical protein
MTTGAVAMDLALSEAFARRPKHLLPARIGCAAVGYSAGSAPSRCPTTAATAADVVCRSCGPRRVFLCDPCLEQTRWRIGAGSLWCSADGALITGLDVAVPLAD